MLIDGHSLIHRAYHAYPKTLATGTGELTNAVYGFTNILLTAISEVQPTHLAVTFDLPKPTFRQTMFVGYKRSRVKPDDELITQIPRVKEVVKTLNIPIYEVEGFEADDVIGALAKQATEEKVKRTKAQKVEKNGDFSSLSAFQPVNLSASVVILTSDRDLMQLIRGEQVVVKMPQRGVIRKSLIVNRDNQYGDIWNEERFIADWGFSPKLLPDYKALAGDQSDDIPGVSGIGQKTASRLIKSFGEINNIYLNLDKVKTDFGDTVARKLIEDQEAAQMSKKLATIDTDVPIKLDWEQTSIHEYEKEKVLKLFEKLEFRSLSKKLPNDKYEQEVQEALF